MKIKNLLLLAVSAAALAGCGQRIRFDEAAVEVVEMGSNAGVQQRTIGTGRYWTAPWSYRYIVKFPTTIQTYKWVDGDGSAPCFSFINADQVQTAQCLSMNVRINPGDAPKIVSKYRGAIGKGGDGYVLDDVVNGPVTRELQQAFIANGGQFTSAQLYADGGRGLLDKVRATVAPKFSSDGIVILDLLSAAPPQLPGDIVASIKGALMAQTEARKKDAELAAIISEGKKTVARAEADAKARDLTGASLRANPEVLRFEEVIRRGKSLCPMGTTTCVIGASAIAQVGG